MTAWPTMPSADAARDEQADALLAAYLAATRGTGLGLMSMKIESVPSGRALADAPAELQAAVVVAAVERMVARDHEVAAVVQERWHGTLENAHALQKSLDELTTENGPIRALVSALARRHLPYDDAQLVCLAEALTTAVGNTGRVWDWLPMLAVMRGVQRRVEAAGLRPAVRAALEAMRQAADGRVHGADERKAVALVAEVLAGPRQLVTCELDGEDDWGDLAREALAAVADDERAGWMALLVHAQTATASKPSKSWQQAARGKIDALGEERFKTLAVRFLGLLDAPPTGRWRKGIGVGMMAGLDDLPTAVPTERNANTLRGLIWCCALLDDEALASAVADAARACFKKLPDIGARSTKVANACLYTLGAMPSGATHLVQLQRTVKTRSARERLDQTMDHAAEQAGLTRDDLEDRAVPDPGLVNGRLRLPVGEYAAEIVVRGPSTVAVEWFGPSGEALPAEPPGLAKSHAAASKQIKATAEAVHKSLLAQRDRVERLVLGEQSWALGDWRQLYVEHPLLGVIARPLIWRVAEGEREALASWLDGRLVDEHDAPLDWASDAARVRLWHPIQSSAATVLAWRLWLERHGVTQPFKQAHREVYLLTPAEEETGTYSNRFAQHILRQHQFRALCIERGWQYGLQGQFDSADTAVPTLDLPRLGLRATFEVEPIDDDDMVSGRGIFMYVSTDRVQFTRLAKPDGSEGAKIRQLRREARERLLSGIASIGTGPLNLPDWTVSALPARMLRGAVGLEAPLEPLALSEIPPVVFSEVMRDVDLFVGVASVGADPEWRDQAPERYAAYWHDFSFGELGSSAQTRRAVLERLLPRLRIAARCTLEDRFLIVRGDRRTYKIHLGSGNILMEPNNQYLCIVPARGSSLAGEPGHVYLPFEGDAKLQVILSKAFLLANDTAIKDASILRQIDAR